MRPHDEDEAFFDHRPMTLDEAMADGLFLPEPDEAEDDDTPNAPPPLYEHFRFTVDPKQSPLRIDKFLIDRMTHTSRNRIQLAADAGCVRVDGEPVRSNYKVKPGDLITIVMAQPRHEFNIIPEDIPLDIVYEDSELLVVNKPAGLVVHPGHGNYSGTLVNALAYHLRDLPGYDPNDPRLGLVHRIDKDTSGLLVVAKNADSKTFLSRQFFAKTTQRRYRTLVWGIPKEEEGRIEGNIGRDLHDRLRMAVYPPGSEEGKWAITHYRVVERLGYVSLLECRLETGRTHQIRAHMSHIGHPVFNDARYGGDRILKGRPDGYYRQFVLNAFDACPRQALHAETLGFVHPTTGRELFFTAPLPADMQHLLDLWRNYCAANA